MRELGTQMKITQNWYSELEHLNTLELAIDKAIPSKVPRGNAVGHCLAVRSATRAHRLPRPPSEYLE
jgi:hypothetical protein